jgi:hypothetical protein
MEEGERRCFVSHVLEDEITSLSFLLFVFHDISWVYGYNWCIGLCEDEELRIFEGW